MISAQPSEIMLESSFFHFVTIFLCLSVNLNWYIQIRFVIFLLKISLRAILSFKAPCFYWAAIFVLFSLCLATFVVSVVIYVNLCLWAVISSSLTLKCFPASSLLFSLPLCSYPLIFIRCIQFPLIGLRPPPLKRIPLFNSVKRSLFMLGFLSGRGLAYAINALWPSVNFP